MSRLYIRYEVLRTVRNRRFFFFSLAFPLILFYLIAGSNRNAHVDGISFPFYYMTGMITFGAMTAVIAGGSRIAVERSAGWTRQLRLTPLSPVAYLQAKLLSSYMMALISILLVSLAGATLGVSLGAGKWVLMAVLILIGLIPFAVMGVALGNAVSADAMGPTQGGITALFSVLGGAFGPIAQHGGLHSVITYIPTYWTVQASKTALGGHVWPAKGWIVIAAWTIVMIRLAALAYRRSAERP